MKWPWVKRIHFDALQALLEVQRELIEEQREHCARIKTENESLKGLFDMKSNFEVVETKGEEVKLKLKPASQTTNVAGRAGFRGARAQREATTVPPVADSIQDLERRVDASKRNGK